MKKLIILSLLLSVTMTIKAAGVKVDRIDPTDWYVGMKNPSLQLMVYGKGIGSVNNVTTDYPGVVVDSIVRVDSPNYLLVYLNLSGAQAGTMTLKFDGKAVKYELKNREMTGDKRQGFDISDVLYLLMPDRFAHSCPTASHRDLTTSHR